MPTPGDKIDRFVVEEKLGRGGMASVYRVRHTGLGSLHALKVLDVRFESMRERLQLEGQVQAQLAHPNIVAVTDLVQVEGAPGLILEYVPGPPLDVWLSEHRPDPATIDALFRGILDGVVHAHGFGLIHRDLKPGNVLLHEIEGRLVPKIADFGLAKLLDDDQPAMTRTGAAMGTPGYMAPEQIRSAKDVDQRADVFALGCILYVLWIGGRPFQADSLIDSLSAIESKSYVPPKQARPDLPDRVAQAIEGCLEPDRTRRIASAAALRSLLYPSAASVAPEPASTGSPSTLAPPQKLARSLTPPPAALGIATGVVALAVLGAGALVAIGVVGGILLLSWTPPSERAVVVTVDGAAPDAVTVDGVALAADGASWRTALPPGAHVLRAAAGPGAAGWTGGACPACTGCVEKPLDVAAGSGDQAIALHLAPPEPVPRTVRATVDLSGEGPADGVSFRLDGAPPAATGPTWAEFASVSYGDHTVVASLGDCSAGAKGCASASVPVSVGCGEGPVAIAVPLARPGAPTPAPAPAPVHPAPPPAPAPVQPAPVHPAPVEAPAPSSPVPAPRVTVRVIAPAATAGVLVTDRTGLVQQVDTNQDVTVSAGDVLLQHGRSGPPVIVTVEPGARRIVCGTVDSCTVK